MILSLSKNEIIINPKHKKTKNSFLLYSSLCVVALISIVCFTNSMVLNDFIAVYNPVNSLYNDNSDVVFTGGGLTKLEFTLPILGAGITNNSGVIEFFVGKSIMVRATESGIVSDCGTTLNGVKYIKIKHSDSVYSVLENLDIIGVAQFDTVKRGQDIATAKVGETVILKIFENDIPVQNLKINQSKISWEN